MASSRKTGVQKTNSALSMRAQNRQQAVPIGNAVEQPTTGQPEQEQIITEIVARDIEGLCRVDYSVKAS